MKRLIPLILLLLFLACGCESASEDMGVVARVNGRPIALSQLEFQHDLLHMDGAGTFVPSVEVLRKEYGRILTDLVVLELVEQELERRGLAVTDEEMAAEEQKVRDDFPDGAFEQVLVEEYIDLASWRRQLRYYTSHRKFFQTVLRPQVKIDYLEADAYYKKHLKDFLLPESYRLVVFRGSMKGDVERCVAAYRVSNDAPNVARKEKDVNVNELTVSAAQLSQVWKDALTELPVGEVSAVLESQFGFEALALLQKLPAKMLDPTQAYPIVEKALLERKIAQAFEKWLSVQLNDADIQISAHLLKPTTDEQQTKTLAPEQESVDSDSVLLESAPVEEESVAKENNQ